MVEAIFVQNESVGNRVDFQKPMPIGVVTSQTGNFQSQDDARFAQADLSHQVLKTLTVRAGSAGLAEVDINDLDLVITPAQSASA